MNRFRGLLATLAVALVSSFPLLTHPPVFGDGPSLEETYAPWRDRISTARAELDKLVAQRQKAQAAYEGIVSQRRARISPIDPEKVAQAEAAISEIEQRIRDKEYEINTTIPDEARRAGVPSSVLSQ
jgi:hypothetical protein